MIIMKLKISITDKDYSKMVIDGKNQETLKQIEKLQNDYCHHCVKWFGCGCNNTN